MTDNVAVLQGYTKQVMAVSSDYSMSMDILIKPEADLDGTFKAWDMDNQEWVRLNGWHWSFEDEND